LRPNIAPHGEGKALNLPAEGGENRPLERALGTFHNKFDGAIL